MENKSFFEMILIEKNFTIKEARKKDELLIESINT